MSRGPSAQAAPMRALSGSPMTNTLPIRRRRGVGRRDAGELLTRRPACSLCTVVPTCYGHHASSLTALHSFKGQRRASLQTPTQGDRVCFYSLTSSLNRFHPSLTGNDIIRCHVPGRLLRVLRLIQQSTPAGGFKRQKATVSQLCGQTPMTMSLRRLRGLLPSWPAPAGPGAPCPWLVDTSPGCLICMWQLPSMALSPRGALLWACSRHLCLLVEGHQSYWKVRTHATPG